MSDENKTKNKLDEVFDVEAEFVEDVEYTSKELVVTTENKSVVQVSEKKNRPYYLRMNRIRRIWLLWLIKSKT